MSKIVECQVCGEDVGYGPSGLGIKQHSKAHKKQFRDLYGRDPDDYQEVIEKLGKHHPTIWETILDDEQSTLSEADR